MGRTRYQHTKDVFYRVCDVPAAERAPALDAACAGDDDLRRDVEQLLASQDRAGSFLTRPAVDGADFRRAAAAGLEAAEHGAVAPLKIARYDVIRLIGEGGMGSVYEARQDSPRRTVAVKVVRPGMLSDRMLRRFEHEVELLGRLHHPGVAQIYEAGVADIVWPSGPPSRQPFLAMELVTGKPLLAAASGLTIPARLYLLAAVCDAVHHGHQRGVVHRDLKPTNILVQEDGKPKVIDFGVARATEPSGPGHTATGQVIGTLAYMSPEQVAGDAGAIDTRTDVYALGVIGYQLLAGRLPLEVEGLTLARAAVMIRDTDPPRLGSVDRSLRGDIETVIGKALEKSPARRYASASDFAADLRRLLRYEPVSARPATALYTLRKFARRNRAAAIGATVALAGLVAGATAAAWQAVVSLRERDRAVSAEGLARQQTARALQEAETAKRIARCLEGVFEAYAPSGVARDGGPPTPWVVLNRSAETVAQELSDRPLEQASLLERIGRIYLEMGLYDRSIAVIASALRLRESAAGPNDPGLVQPLENLAWLQHERGDDEAAIRTHQRATTIQIAAAGPDDPSIANIQHSMSAMLLRIGRLEEAELAAREALRVATLRGNAEVINMVDQQLAAVLEKRSDFAGAAKALADGIAITSDNPSLIARSAALRFELSGLLGRAGDGPGADHALSDATAAWNRVPDPLDLPGATAAISIASALDDAGRRADAEAFLRRALAACRSLLGDDAPATADATTRLATSLHEQGRFQEASAHYRAALAAYRHIGGEQHPNVGACLFRLAQVAAAAGDPESLRSLSPEADDLRRLAAGLPPTHPHRSGAALLAGYIALELGDPARAEPLLRECVALREATLPPGHRLTAYAKTVLAGALTAQGRLPEAESLLDENASVVAARFGPRSLMAAEVEARRTALAHAKAIATPTDDHSEPPGR